MSEIPERNRSGTSLSIGRIPARQFRPCHKLLTVLDHMNRNFVVGLECFFRVRLEGIHAVPSIGRKRRWGDFKVKPPLVDDAEKLRSVIESVPAEHGTTGHIVQFFQLIQHEILETVGLHGHQTI